MRTSFERISPNPITTHARVCLFSYDDDEEKKRIYLYTHIRLYFFHRHLVCFYCSVRWNWSKSFGKVRRQIHDQSNEFFHLNFVSNRDENPVKFFDRCR